MITRVTIGSTGKLSIIFAIIPILFAPILKYRVPVIYINSREKVGEHPVLRGVNIILFKQKLGLDEKGK